MKIRIIVFFAALAAIAGLFYFVKHDAGVPIPMQQPMGGQPPMGGGGQEMPHATGTALPTIVSAMVTAQDESGKEFPALKLIPGKLTPLPDSHYSLKATEFYTHWNWDVRAVNLSFEEKNAAVKIEIYHNGELQSHGWGFKNIPYFRMGGEGGMHPNGEPGGSLAFTLVSYEGLKIPQR